MYRIKQLREERGLSQRALAFKVGVTPKAVNFWEQEHAEPTAKSICALADVFETSTDYILGREDEAGNVNVMRELSEEEKYWLSLYSKMNKHQVAEVNNFINYLLSQNK